MSTQHSANWVETSKMLREAIEQYRGCGRYTPIRVIYDIISYIDRYSPKENPLSEKTIKRDIGNKPTSKKLHPIPKWRIEIYAKWLYEQVGKDREWLAQWLEHTMYPSPGKLLVDICNPNIKPNNAFVGRKSNVPPLRNLWGEFLGHQEEIEKIRQWADTQRHPIAILFGFGGNGKTTIQLKMGEEFVYSIGCPLRWPYEGAVWVSALDYPRGQPNLLDVLRTVARTFGLFDNQANLELIRANVITDTTKKLLQEKRILVLLDNFETVSTPNQIEILEFFNSLWGASQVLISTRYRIDWLLAQEQDIMHKLVHVPIPVGGLSPQDAETLIKMYISQKSLNEHDFHPNEIRRLIQATRNNPKTILAVLGLVEQGASLSHILDAITSGNPEADSIFDAIIDRAWEEILTEHDKAVLMTKAFFSHSVSQDDLGQVADVRGVLLQQATKRLAAISFFEFERTQQTVLRIKTHPLAQDFASRILRDHPEFERNAEDRWWSEYGPNVVQERRPGSNRSESLAGSAAASRCKCGKCCTDDLVIS